MKLNNLKIKSYLNGFFILVFSILLMSCGKNEEINYEPITHYIDEKIFNDFKQSIDEKIKVNSESIKSEKSLMVQQRTSLLETISRIDTKVEVVAKDQLSQRTTLALLEDRIETLVSKQVDLSKKIDERILTQKNQQKKALTKTKLDLTIENVWLWGSHYVIYAKHNADTISLRENDTYSGWLVEKIDYAEKHISFRHLNTNKTIVKAIP